MTTWGRHLILDLSGCPPKDLRSPAVARGWVDRVLAETGMQAFGPKFYGWGAEGNQSAYGPSLLVPIETSHISAHLCVETGELYADVFTCGELDHERLAEMTADHFGASAYERLMIKRQAGARPCVQTWSSVIPARLRADETS